MKIALFTDCFIPHLDGVVISTLNLAKGLADRGHKIYITAPGFKNIKEFEYKNIVVKRIPGIPSFFYSGLKFTTPFNTQVFKFLKKEKIDIIHLQTPLTIGINARIFTKYLKVPLIGTFHTLFMHEQYLEHIKITNKIMQKTGWKYAKRFYNKCDIITCPTESIKKELIKRGFKSPILAISNGVDFKKFDNSNQRKIKEKYNPDGKLLLFVGRIASEKNLFYLVDCFKYVLEKMPSAKLILVGDGPLMKKLKIQVHKMGLAENIIFTGRIEHKDLISSSIFEACNLFVTASKTETQGISMLEAQSNGLVCVGLDANGTKDLITDGYNGFLINEGDKKGFAEKILMLLNNAKLHEKMKRNTLKEVKKHSMNRIIDTWEKTYQDLIKSKKKVK